MQWLAADTGLTIRVCHLPPGTSNWGPGGSPIEHRLFSFIRQNWRATPLVRYAVILHLIAATTTAPGLTVESYRDTAPDPAGPKVADAQLATLRLPRDAFHGEWTDTAAPRDPVPRGLFLDRP